jgi:hypothetical protein
MLSGAGRVDEIRIDPSDQAALDEALPAPD